VPRVELSAYSCSACAIVIPSLTSPRVVPDSLPVAPGQRATFGAGTLTPWLVAGALVPARFVALTVQVSV
jgi:hypothetical protein